MVNDAISYFAIAKLPMAAAARVAGSHPRETGLLEMVQTKYIDVDRLPRREKPVVSLRSRSRETATLLAIPVRQQTKHRLSHATSALKICSPTTAYDLHCSRTLGEGGVRRK